MQTLSKFKATGFYRLFVFLIFFNLFSPKEANSQESNNLPAVNIVSPTASSLGKYVDFPTNLHTGVPDIGIPIYTVQEGPLQLPVSLSYHAAGVPVLEVASWVGTGWSLNAGGVISRTVKGIADDSKVEGKSFLLDAGFSEYIYDTLPWGPAIHDYKYFSDGLKDGQPDLFTFSFGGYGGKFYLREDGTVMAIPKGDLKIDPVFKDEVVTEWTQDYLQGFIITTPEGVRYHFGIPKDGVIAGDNPVDESEMSTILGGPSWSDFISSWYLHKIQSADSLFDIDIVYRKESYGYLTVSTQPCLPDCDGSVTLAKVLVRGVVPSEIRFIGGTVKFIADTLREDVGSGNIFMNDPNTQAKRLDEIKIESPQSQLCKSFRFSYDYFIDTSSNELPYVLTQNSDTVENHVLDKKRLKLTSLQEFSCDNSSSHPPFAFEYYDEDMVPRRLSLGVDHWGFYNGIETNTNLFPSLSADNGITYDVGANREAKWPAMRAGALRIIKYPTGGGTEYVYEPNRVTTTPNCTYETSFQTQASAVAGMGTTAEAWSAVDELTVTEPTLYYYSVSASGTGASGKFYIDGFATAVVNPNETSKSDYILLQPGLHTFQSYANADQYSGSGVSAFLYSVDITCDAPQEKIVGGLRIKQINKFGVVDSPKLSMTYNYEDASLYSVPNYMIKMKNGVLLGLDDDATEHGCVTAGDNVVVARSPSSIHPLQTVQGYHIGYRKVKEIFPDGGYTLYEYNGNNVLPAGWLRLEDVSVRKIDNTVCSTLEPSYPVAPIPYDPHRGSLISKQVFDKSNRKLTETIHSQQYQEDPVGAFGIATSPFADVDGLPIVVTHYEVRTGQILWQKQVEKVFDENGSSIDNETITYFESTHHRMPTRKTQISTTDSVELKYVYGPDLTDCKYYEYQEAMLAYVEEVNAIKADFLAKEVECKNLICSPSDFLGWPHGPAGGGPCGDGAPTGWKIANCRMANWLDYEYRVNLARRTFVAASRNWMDSSSYCLDNGIASTVFNNQVKALYLLEKGNELKIIESSAWKNSNLQSSSFFGYEPAPGDTKVYLKNVYATEIATPMNSFNPVAISSGAFIKDIQYNIDPVSTFLFSGGQPVEIKERNGIVTSYIWGFDNTLPVVKAIGVDYATLQSAFANSSVPIRTSIYNSKPHAQVSEYTYDPLLGIATVTDPNGRVLYYEYDKLGRLIRIKDHDGKILEETEYTYRLD